MRARSQCRCALAIIHSPAGLRLTAAHIELKNSLLTVTTPSGAKLQWPIDDISLAGRLQPIYRPGQQDMRVMKESYWPWMNLHFVLLAADGTTIREGEAKLSDGSYLRRAVASDPNDPLRYDKRMVDEWLRTEFGPNSS